MGVKWLLEDWVCGTDLLKKKDERGNPPMHVAAATDNVEAAKMILDICGTDDERKGILQATNAKGWTPLHIAVFIGKNKMVKWLLEDWVNGTDLLKKKNERGYTPMHIAAGSDNVEAAKMILEKCGTNDDERKGILQAKNNDG